MGAHRQRESGTVTETTKLQQGDLLLLNSNDDRTLADWWCVLNRWEWPERIPNPEDPKAERPTRRSALMHEILNRIGLEACLTKWRADLAAEQAQ